MATSKPLSEREPPAASNLLAEELNKVLPAGVKFKAYHLSTPPTTCDPLCFAPAIFPTAGDDSKGTNEPPEPHKGKPLKTYCEKHFLAITIDHPPNGELLALALEIYIFTTSHSSILFVSKADSTGYLSLLNLPKGSPSPIRETAAAFVSFLISNRKRPGKQFVINLFARAQDQYLFPGSIKNKGKHVLDDRGLVKWWCRVLNPLLEGEAEQTRTIRRKWGRIHGYLVIPGFDAYDTRAFLPRTPSATSNWTLGHPLKEISPYSTDKFGNAANVPPRCLIPVYPDDPKARYVLELEESTPEKYRLSRGWKSLKTLDEFWEMLAFRQECSSGRMTGFVWIVFDPHTKTSAPPRLSVPSAEATTLAPGTPRNVESEDAPPSTPITQQATSELATPTTTPRKRDPRPSKKRAKKKVLRGPIRPRQPMVKTHQRNHFPKEIETSHYYWPETGRGQVVVNEASYKRSVELLLHLDFATLELAVTSTSRWIGEVNVGEGWGWEIIGERKVLAEPVSNGATPTAVINNLSGMVKRKQPTSDAEPAKSADAAAVNTLGAGLVRKKVKVTPAEHVDQGSGAGASQVNVLSTGLVRKKPKTT